MRGWGFLAAYAAVVALALLWPEVGRSGGWLRLDLLRDACLAGIFLVAGLALPAAGLRRAAAAWRAHVAIQTTSFAVAPAAALALAGLASGLGLPEAVGVGLIVLGCLPTTIGSCVALTALAGGAQGVALVNAVLGNLIGLALAPLLVLLLAGRAVEVPYADLLGHLLLIAALPVAVGQTLRLGLAQRCDAMRGTLSWVGNGLLLTVLLSLFSDLAHRGLADEALATVPAVVAFHLLLLGLATVAARLAVTDRGERIAIVITASQKTAALGIPLILVLYAGDPALSLVMLPIALYHAVQMTFGAVLAAWLGRKT